MDDIKRNIINEMMRDNSQPMKNIADEVGKSESYVSKIVKELKKDAILNETIHLNYKNLGYNNHAFSLIKIKDINKTSPHEISQKIALQNEAIEVFTVFGHHDIYVRWLCQDPESIMKNIELVLDHQIIESIETFNLGACYKREFGPKV